MMIRTTNQELVDIIKDMTKALPDCGHQRHDPNSCFICAGKVITKADDEGNLIINKHNHDSIRINNGFRKESRAESFAT